MCLMKTLDVFVSRFACTGSECLQIVQAVSLHGPSLLHAFPAVVSIILHLILLPHFVFEAILIHLFLFWFINGIFSETP